MTLRQTTVLLVSLLFPLCIRASDPLPEIAWGKEHDKISFGISKNKTFFKADEIVKIRVFIRNNSKKVFRYALKRHENVFLLYDNKGNALQPKFECNKKHLQGTEVINTIELAPGRITSFIGQVSKTRGCGEGYKLTAGKYQIQHKLSPKIIIEITKDKK